MLREVISRLLNEYAGASNEKFASHPLATWIRHEVPKIFASTTPEFPNIVWAASPGKGRWADAPWIAAFDPLVTETAREGYYPVYLLLQRKVAQ